MKNKNYIGILGAFLAIIVFIASCKKEEPIKLAPQMATWGVAEITSTSAIVRGLVVAQGDGFSEYGVCWNTAAEPTVDVNSKKADSVSNAVYKVTVDSLEYLTKYYVRAYVKANDGSVIYGDDTTFTTLANAPFVKIDSIGGIMGKTASVYSDAYNDGKAKISRKGIVWSSETNPTLDDNIVEGGSDTGKYQVSIVGLDGATKYYVKSFAINKMGTTYGDETNFTSLAASPTLTSDSLTDVTKTEIKAYGTVIVNGGATVTERGVCWSTSAMPTIAGDYLAASAAGLGDFNVLITNLDPGVEYHIRAYATNSKGTEYGDELTQKTVTDIQRLYVPGGYQKASGYSDGDWNPAAAPFILNTKADKTVKGYVYFASANDFKFTSDPDWGHTNYGIGSTAGTLSTDPSAGNLSVPSAGLYLLEVDLVKLTYKVTKMDWSLIGGAIDPSWGVDVDMVYNSTLHKLVASYDFASGDIKFRANHDWAVNYGDDNADGTLEPGGANIGIAAAGKYSVFLDLNTKVDANDTTLKLDYSYWVTQWGIIGDATPGGWGDETSMTADVANNTWTYTGFLIGGKQFKFRANHDWGINLGGTPDKLSEGGDNIDVPADGNYTVVLNLTDGTFTLTAN